jgi:hypothetical protein
MGISSTFEHSVNGFKHLIKPLDAHIQLSSKIEPQVGVFTLFDLSVNRCIALSEDKGCKAFFYILNCVIQVKTNL